MFSTIGNFLVSGVVAFIIFVLSHSPKFFFPVYSKICEVIVLAFARKELKHFRSNVEKIFGLPGHCGFTHIFRKQCVHHSVSSALESVRGIFDDRAVTVIGFDEYRDFVSELARSNRPLIFITAHLGSWELMGKFSSATVNGQLHVLAKPAPIKSLTNAMDKLREKARCKVIWTDCKNLAKEMLTTLKHQGNLGFVMDQKPAHRGVPINFFGFPSEFVSGPATMALRTNAEIIACFMVRESAWRYRLFFEKISYDAEHSDADSLTISMAAVIEKYIKLYPEQWTWNYRRWRFKS